MAIHRIDPIRSHRMREKARLFKYHNSRRTQNKAKRSSQRKKNRKIIERKFENFIGSILLKNIRERERIIINI